MNRIVLMLIAVALASGGSLFAQSGKIAVKKGAKFTYTVDTKFDMTQNVGGQDMGINSVSAGTIAMTARNVSASKIDWSYGVSAMKMAMKSPVLPGGGIDTTIKGKMINFSTDAAGRVKDAGKLAVDPALGAIGGGLQKMSAEQMFSPLLSRTLKAGDFWEENNVDTVSTPALQGAKIFVKKTTRYTYDGQVDTLNTTASRVRAEVTSMEINGDVSVQGMKVKIDGDGTSLCTSYYSQKDGLLVASGCGSTINMRLVMAGQMQMIIPMIYKISSVMERKGI